MEIKASTVKELRDSTGAGMMDCKKALVQANGDFAEAEKILKKMGLAAVSKRADRATDNGRVFTFTSEDKAAMLELSCETDFVASNADFGKLGDEMVKVIAEKNYTEANEELNSMVAGLIAIIKENMTIKKIYLQQLAADEYAASYIHGNTKGVIVTFKADNAEAFKNADVVEFCHDCALHIAAFDPSYLDPESVDEKYLAEQTEIFNAQALRMGKPEKILPNIVKGMINKHFSEICFTKQAFVKDDKVSVEKKMAEVGKAAGAKLTCTGYKVFTVGL